MTVETLTPKKLLILALQEAERNGNNIYIICLYREYTYRFNSSTLISIPELVWGFMLTAIGYRWLSIDAHCRFQLNHIGLPQKRGKKSALWCLKERNLLSVLIKFFSNQCIHIKNNANVNSHHYLK
ncbi:hypothetical protein DY000_02012688 [Brassica cretica]|uniref:Uncharacterized protein n=1 Tax=Brassica cretica TaxID=69181 RepID=A0ABQ7CUM2_BRACR|nr:hypothetical protein DY000_02012688 [Brassica cretica]